MNNWKLLIGCHRGTMMSRDSHAVTTKFGSSEPLQSLEDCRECAKDWQQNYADLGIYLWYANAISPDGTKHSEIIPGQDYR